MNMNAVNRFLCVRSIDAGVFGASVVPPAMLALLLAPLAFAAPAPPATGSRAAIQSIVERPLDLKRTRGYEVLEIKCEAVVDTPGTYTIDPVIQVGPNCEGWTFPGTVFGSDRPTFELSDGGQTELLARADSLGRVRFTAYFDGNDLWRLEVDGPWVFCCRFILRDNIDPVTGHPPGYAWIDLDLGVPTRPWHYRQFARRYGGELGPYIAHPFDMRSGEDLIYTQGYDLVVATVVSADSQGTNAAPPSVRLLVLERLYGSLPTGELAARWLPWHLYMPCCVGEEGTIARWRSEQIPAPKVGSRWILGGRRASRDDTWGFEPMCRWVYSDSLRGHFIKVSRTWPARLRELEREAAVEARARQERERRQAETHSSRER